jgi:hypothetical protein
MMGPCGDRRTVTILVLKHCWYSLRFSVFPTELCAVTKHVGREAFEHSAAHCTDMKAIN